MPSLPPHLHSDVFVAYHTLTQDLKLPLLTSPGKPLYTARAAQGQGNYSVQALATLYLLFMLTSPQPQSLTLRDH